jgi:hypothetical protein
MGINQTREKYILTAGKPSRLCILFLQTPRVQQNKAFQIHLLDISPTTGQF